MRNTARQPMNWVQMPPRTTPALAPAALEAVRQWKYRPFMLNGKAVEVETQVTVSFFLREN